MSTDEHYAAPLAVTVGSLLNNLRPGVGLDLYLMDGGLAPETRGRLESAWGGRVQLHWVSFDARQLEPLRGYGYAAALASYARLLVGSSLPDHVSKVIFLDADMLIQRDLCELWDLDMGGNIVLAVQDSYVQSLRVPGSREQTSRPYFNSGLMVIDLDRWRAAGIERACLDGASQLRGRTKWLDQHLLNVCLAGRWAALPPVWNKQYFLDVFPDWQSSPYAEREFVEARSHPAIIHFCSSTKPWHPFCDHPPQDIRAYRAVLRETGLAGDLDAKPALRGRFGEFFAAPHRRMLDTLAAAVQANRRSHAIRAMLPRMLRLGILHPWTLVSVPFSVARERIAMRMGT